MSSPVKGTVFRLQCFLVYYYCFFFGSPPAVIRKMTLLTSQVLVQAPGSFESGGRAFSSAADVHDKLSSLQLKELLDAQGVCSNSKN